MHPKQKNQRLSPPTSLWLYMYPKPHLNPHVGITDILYTASPCLYSSLAKMTCFLFQITFVFERSFPAYKSFFTLYFYMISPSKIFIPNLSISTRPSKTVTPSAVNRSACTFFPPNANAPDNSPFAFTTRKQGMCSGSGFL